MGFTEISFFRPGWTLKIFRHTAIADSEEVTNVANRCAYRENVLDEERYSFVLKV